MMRWQPNPELAELGFELTLRLGHWKEEDLKTASGEYKVWEVDLDSDGIDELCIQAETSMTCSNGVGTCQHLLWSQKEDRLLLETSTHRLGYGGGIAENGFPGIRSVWFAPDGFVWEQAYVYSGTEYMPVCSRPIGQWTDAPRREPEWHGVTPCADVEPQQSSQGGE